MLLFSVISKPYSASTMTHLHGSEVSGSGGTNQATLISISILRSLSNLTPWQLFASSSKGRDVHFNLLLSVRSSVLSAVLSNVQLFATPWTVARQAHLPHRIFQARILDGMGCHFLLQGIFPTQGSNLLLLHLLHSQVDSLPPLQTFLNTNLHFP